MPLKIRVRESNMVTGFMDLMSRHLDEDAEEPKVGIFWYSPTHGCFGVDYRYYSEAPFEATEFFDQKANMGRWIHQNYWPYLKRKGKLPKEYSLISDYTRIPRGRVFGLEDGTFKVMHGKWLDNCPDARRAIVDEFDLPADRTEFVYDSHWDIGVGWDEER